MIYLSFTENVKIFLSWGSNVKTAQIDWIFVVYIDTGSSMPISPSKSCDLADENNKILTEWKWFETTVLIDRIQTPYQYHRPQFTLVHTLSSLKHPRQFLPIRDTLYYVTDVTNCVLMSFVVSLLFCLHVVVKDLSISFYIYDTQNYITSSPRYIIIISEECLASFRQLE